MSHNKSVNLAWQFPDTRDWHVVGHLTEKKDGYFFNYTNGAKSEGFIPFSGMEDIYKTYISEKLFPLFQNRLLSPKRPEYPGFLHWLGLSSDDNNPITILGRSGGTRKTDKLQVFNRIEFDKNGYFEHIFFAHGLSHLSNSANKRVSMLMPSEKLFFCLDSQNEYDEKAVLIRVGNPAEIVGFCPRYLAEDITTFIQHDKNSIKIRVENLSDSAPNNYRLMCRVSGNIEKKLIDKFSMNEEFQFITKS